MMGRLGRTEQMSVGHVPSRRKRARVVLTSALVMASVATIAPIMSSGSSAAPIGAGFVLDGNDLRFILTQIQTAEAHAGGAELCISVPGDTSLCAAGSLVPEPRLPFGLRTVDGSYNHLLPGQAYFGASDRIFPRMTTPVFRDAEPLAVDVDGPGGQEVGEATTYKQRTGFVNDSQPRTITNLIVDQTIANPAAKEASEGCPQNNDDPSAPGLETCDILNVAPDAGLSAPFNSMFTFFGQFFDHGLDLTNKGGGTVFVPLKDDDPLVLGTDGLPGTADDLPPQLRFMVLSRSDAMFAPGPDGVLGTTDDIREAVNQTTPFVDQNQTYTSHPSHQVFLRAYVLDATGARQTGRLIDGAIAGNIGNWNEVKAQAASVLGIRLVDSDVHNVPLVATDPYGHFIPGPHGFPQLVSPSSPGSDGLAGTADDGLVEGNPSAPVPIPADNPRTRHEFLNDIAHHAVPGQTSPGECPGPPRPKTADTADSPDPYADDHDCATYDDELLGVHFVTGDGRGNENIALTAVHSIFHSEHNRLAGYLNTLIHTPGVLSAAEVAAWEAVPTTAAVGVTASGCSRRHDS